MEKLPAAATPPPPRAARGPIVLPGPPVLSGPTRRPFELAREPSHPASGLPRVDGPIIGTGLEPPLPRRPKTRPVYYDDSGTADHAAVSDNVASALPAVLQTENEARSRTVGPS